MTLDANERALYDQIEALHQENKALRVRIEELSKLKPILLAEEEIAIPSLQGAVAHIDHEPELQIQSEKMEGLGIG